MSYKIIMHAHGEYKSVRNVWERIVSNDCLFCRIASGDIPADVVYSDDHVVAFRDIDPKAPVHVLVIPRQHVATLADLGPEHDGVMERLVQTANRIAGEEGVTASGYRLVVNCNKDGGQSVYHIHLHLLGGRKMSWPPG